MSEYLRDLHQKMTADKQAGRKCFAVLLDPDKMKLSSVDKIILRGKEAGVDYFFIGGSLIVNDMLDQTIAAIKKACDIPVILFPGNSYQLSYKADAILLLSLISGRNPELLIGNHVLAAPYLKVSPLEILSTGYLLIDGGVETTVSYISNTRPIPANKPDIASTTAIAGEMLGLKLMFLDAGSGAKIPVTGEIIQAVSSNTNVPLIVGGGIRTAESAVNAIKHGADIVVVGNAIEQDTALIEDISFAIHSYRTKSEYV